MTKKHYQLVLLLAIKCAFFLNTGVANAQHDDSIVAPLSKAELLAFRSVTEQKIKELEQYIIILADKQQERERRDLAETEAARLFYTDAMMEISFISPSTKEISVKTYPIKEYFYRLKIVPFSKVSIEYYDIAYVNDFTLGADGRYYATATIYQKFTGYSGDNMKYTDMTKKEIEVIIEKVENAFDNETYWKVFLGNVKAAETKVS